MGRVCVVLFTLFSALCYEKCVVFNVLHLPRHNFSLTSGKNTAFLINKQSTII